MKCVVRFRWEGDITVDCKSTEDAAEKVVETIGYTSLYNTSVHDYDTDPVEILDVKIVGPS